MNIDSAVQPQTITFPVAFSKKVVPVLGCYFSSYVNDMVAVISGSLTFTQLKISWPSNNLNVDGSLIIIGI